MRKTRAVFIFCLGLFLLGSFSQGIAQDEQPVSFSGCEFVEITTSPQDGRVPFQVASNEVVYESEGDIQLAEWGSATNHVLVARDISASNRQSVEMLDLATGATDVLSTRARTNLAPRFEQGELALMDWELSRSVFSAETPPCPSAFGNLQVLQFAFSPDNRYLAAITADPRPDLPHDKGQPFLATQLVLLDFELGTRRVLQPFPQYVTDLAWGPHGWLAILGVLSAEPFVPEVGGLAFVEAATGLVSFSGVGDPLGGGVWGTQLLWSADGSQLLASCPTVENGRICQLPILRVAKDRLPMSHFDPAPDPRDLLPDTSPGRAYVTPSEITVIMYRLTASGAPRTPYTLCTPETDTAFGCTAFCSEAGYGCPLDDIIPYPYDSSTITISLETDYLPDVVPRELGVWYDPVALEVQAVAARSYALWHWVNEYPYNNSIWYQAFIPLTFEWQWPANYPDDADNQWNDPCGANLGDLNFGQSLVCAALASPDYISYHAYDNYPARAQFSADAYASTDDGSRAYEVGINDLISTACDANNFGHRWGMSQEGASRWARGHQCSWHSAAVIQGNPAGGPWSVQWNRDQILAHYYAGVHVLDSDINRTTPVFRWNPLRVSALENTVLQSGGSLFDLYLQNTGTSSWGSETLGVQQVWLGAGEIYTTVVATSLDLALADDTAIDIALPPNLWPAPGVYSVTVDLARWDAASSKWEPFATREAGYPWHTLSISIEVINTYERWLPIILKGE